MPPICRRPLPPPYRSPFTLASTSPRFNFKTMWFFFLPHPAFAVRSADLFPFVTTYLCITHLFLIISPLIFQFSFLCYPRLCIPFLLPGLKRFTSPLSQCLGNSPPVPRPYPTPNPLRLRSYLPLYIPSSLPFLSLFSIFRLSYLLYSPSLSALYPFSLLPHPPHNPQLKLDPVGVSLAQATSPYAAQPHGPKTQTLKNKIKYIKTANRFTALWPVYISG